MKYNKVLEIINEDPIPGFMVDFEWLEGGILRGDHFPEKLAGEKLIETEEEAWRLARRFAKKTKGRCVNICVVGANFVPVDGYELRLIKNR